MRESRLNETVAREFYDPATDTYPTTERDDWLCSCGKTYAEASQELEQDTSCVYCGSDNWTPPPIATMPTPGGTHA